ncbi:BppU family phage baseplate upper protein, partial [Clostridium perfringens]
MAKKDIKFTLDTIDSRYSPVGTVKQLDSVFFYIKITENGVTKDLTGQTIKLFAIKEDKKIVEQTTKINITNQREGLVEIELLNAAIQVHGFTYFELEISDSNGIISTSDFILRVNKRVGSDEAIESTNEVAALKKIEEYVAQAKVELQKFKELQTEMLKTNETINNQEDLRADAELQRVEAENARAVAEEERMSAEQAREENFAHFEN